MPMRWANPEFLALFSLMPILLGACWIAERRRATVERLLGDPAALRVRSGAPGPALRWARYALILAATAFAIAGIARPQAGFRLVTTTSRGVDLVVALDLSHSMEARDVRPDRLRAAKRELLSLFSALEGSAIGVVEFAGTARVLSPLATDRGARGRRTRIHPGDRNTAGGHDPDRRFDRRDAGAATRSRRPGRDEPSRRIDASRHRAPRGR